MLIAHISDFHLFAHRPETSLVRPDTPAACRKVVADLAALSPGVDAVLFTGDLTDGGSDDDYALLRRTLAPIRVPILVVPGNHDRRETLSRAFSDAVPFGPGPELNYEARLPGVRVLALDTLVEGRVSGALSEAQLDWLAGKLSAPSEVLTIVIMHHPAFPSGIAPLDRMSLVEGRERFSAVIAAYRGALRIHAGHIHRPFQSMWNGVFCSVGGSPAFQHELTLDPEAEEPGGIREPYAYFLHKIEGPDLLSVHARYVDL
jgi:3',5'-cyclic AMP phosphodiesterase CpdA